MKRAAVILALVLSCPIMADREPITIESIIQGRDDGTPEWSGLRARWVAFTSATSNVNAAAVEFNQAQMTLTAATARMALARVRLISALDACSRALTNSPVPTLQLPTP